MPRLFPKTDVFPFYIFYIRNFVPNYVIQIVTFSLLWMAILFYFNQLHFHALFLYCESGWYLNASASAAQAWRFWLNADAFTAYNGHYTPLAFGLEILQSYFFGSNEHLWLLRQTAALTTLGYCTAAFVRSAAPPCRKIGWPAAVSVAVIFIAQPALLDLVAWPFMIMQLGCLSATLISLRFLMQYADRHDSTSAFRCLFFAYLSMHFFGIGIAFSLAAILAVCAIFLMQNKSDISNFRTTLIWLAFFLTITVAHGAIMILRNTLASPSPIGLQFLLSNFGAITGNIVFWGFRSLWMPGEFQIPSSIAFVTDNIYGWVLFLLSALTLATALLRTPSQRTTRFVALATFALISLAIYTFMILLRLTSEQPEIYGLFVIGQRYIIFGAFFFLVITICIGQTVTIGNTAARYALPLLAIGAVLANATFIRYQMPQLWPHLTGSSARVWRQVKQDAASALAENRPIPDPVIAAGQCVRRAHDFPSLLKRDLRLPADSSLHWAQ